MWVLCRSCKSLSVFVAHKTSVGPYISVQACFSWGAHPCVFLNITFNHIHALLLDGLLVFEDRQTHRRRWLPPTRLRRTRSRPLGFFTGLLQPQHPHLAAHPCPSMSAGGLQSARQTHLLLYDSLALVRSKSTRKTFFQS